MHSTLPAPRWNGTSKNTAADSLRRTASTPDGVIFRLPPLTYQAVGCRLQIQAEGFFLR